MGSRENEFQIVQRNCANTGNITSPVLPSVSYEFQNVFSKIVLLEMISFINLRRYLKQSHRIADTIVYNLGTQIMSASVLLELIVDSFLIPSTISYT